MRALLRGSSAKNVLIHFLFYLYYVADNILGNLKSLLPMVELNLAHRRSLNIKIDVRAHMPKLPKVVKCTYFESALTLQIR